ncbi:AraC family transcriptional regulator [Undibacterium parvum]|uniref:AraC family transcriptional regulator n=1 Tax=Undibacterium parvum TaxID=401471 RepID=A0A3Q9BP80_9BURK|nr:AraC family transcriptional regulator [Undibacterium parvum]AZP11257.1 AraC family transcriptional regulator [Undibacterium parvum]
MNRQSSTISIGLANDLLEGFRADAVLTQRLIAKAEIAPELLAEQGGRITIEQFSTLLRQTALLLDDETPGFFSRPLRNGTLKFLCLGMLDAPNLDIALHRFVSFFRLVLDDMGFEIQRGERLTRIALVERVAPQGVRVLVHELMLKLVHGVASWMIGRKIPLEQVDFSYSRPTRATEYVYLFPGPIHFDQPATAVYFDTEYLSAPLRQDKSALNQFLRNAPADWLYVPFNDKILTHHIRDYLESRLATVTNVASTAKALHFSVRTLSRRLAEEGTSFQVVKDELRRDMAILQLIKTELPVAEIGLSLGYDDTTTFSRAFKQWTGSAPGTYRRLGIG